MRSGSINRAADPRPRLCGRPDPMPRLTLQIKTSESPSGWLANWSVDGQKVGKPIAVEGPASRAMGDLSKCFLKLFEPVDLSGQRGRPLTDPEALRAFGRGL